MTMYLKVNEEKDLYRWKKLVIIARDTNRNSKTDW